MNREALAAALGALDPELRQVGFAISDALDAALPASSPLRDTVVERIVGAVKNVLRDNTGSLTGARVLDLLDYTSAHFYDQAAPPLHLEESENSDLLRLLAVLGLDHEVINGRTKSRLLMTPGALDVFKLLKASRMEDDLFGWWLLMMAAKIIEGVDEVESVVAEHASWGSDRLRREVSTWVADEITNYSQAGLATILTGLPSLRAAFED